MRSLWFALGLFCFSAQVYAQEYLVPMNRDYQLMIGRVWQEDTTGFHTSLQPYAITDWPGSKTLDSVQRFSLGNPSRHSGWWGRKLFDEHLVQVDADDLLLSIDPIVNLSVGTDRIQQRNVFVNTRGVLVQGNVKNRFFFYSSFHENQARYISYVDSLVRLRQVVPGQGKVKFLDNEVFDFSMATGGLAYHGGKHFDVVFAQDKLFIGDGYRSMLLSDNGYPMPFLRANMTFWKFRYSVIYTVMQDLQSTPDQNIGYPKKYATFHYLDLNVGRRNRLSLGLFEAVLWKPAASRGYELHYLNPFLFIRPVENSLGSPDNALLGLNVRWKASSSLSVYGQVMLDEFLLDEVRAGKGWWGNKQALQAGVKSMDVAGVQGLNAQTEFNLARPFTYQHRSSAQNYTHYNQPLAHPLGADFYESITFLNYRYHRFFAEMKFQYAVTGKDTGGVNLGNDIFESYDTRPTDYGYYLVTGYSNRLQTFGFRMNYLFNPKTNLVVEAGYERRRFNGPVDGQATDYFYFGLRTALENYYFDF